MTDQIIMTKKVNENVNVLKMNVRIVSILLVLAIISSTTQFAQAAAPTSASYAAVFNAAYYAEHNADIKAICGTNEATLFQHFITSGMKEGRQASEEFNVQAYKARYSDLQAVFGDNLVLYYQHYILSGKAEGRNGRADGNTATVQNKVPLGTVKMMSGNGANTRRVGYVVKGYTSQGVPLYVQEAGSDYKFEICPYVMKYVEEIGITNAMSEKEKADAIAMYVAKHISYGYCDTTPLHCGKAVCMDYGSVFYGICRLFGIEAYEVTSYEIDHEWNCVIINGVTYYYDTTWISNYMEYHSDDYTQWLGTTADVFFKDGKHTASDIKKSAGYLSDDITEIFDLVYLRTNYHRCPYKKYGFR